MPLPQFSCVPIFRQILLLMPAHPSNTFLDDAPRESIACSEVLPHLLIHADAIDQGARRRVSRAIKCCCVAEYYFRITRCHGITLHFYGLYCLDRFRDAITSIIAIIHFAHERQLLRYSALLDARLRAYDAMPRAPLWRRAASRAMAN